MAKKTTQDLERMVIDLVHALADAHGGSVRRFSIYPAASGEYPYQVEITGEQLPFAGLARDASPPAIFNGDDTPVSGPEQRAG